MKILPPTMRNKKRYLAIKVESEEEIKRGELIKSIWNEAIALYGDYGTAKIGLWIHDYDGKYGIIECDNNSTDKIEKIMSQVYFVNNKKTRIHVLGYSGTINKVKKKFIQRKNE